MIYNKLVRDKIPSIIESQGKTPKVCILDDDAYALALERKLDEEVGEFHKEKNPEELADILEVVSALAENLGCTTEEFPRPAPRPRFSALEKRRLREENLPPMPHWEEALRVFINQQFNQQGVSK